MKLILFTTGLNRKKLDFMTDVSHINSKRFSIVVPCFNESRGLKLLIEEASDIADSSGGEFIFVDNGSTDSTLEILQQIQSSNIRWVSTPNNLGYGGGILLGIKYCNSDIIGWTHADLQTPLQDTINAVGEIEKGFEFVKGRRTNRRFSDGLFTLGMSVYESIVFRRFLLDINAQPTVFRKSLVETWRNPPSDFSLDLYALVMAKKSNLRMSRVQVHFYSRRFGQSSWNLGAWARWKFVLRTVKYSINLKKQLRNVNN